MPVPSTITDLSDTASSNFPQDSDSTGSTVASLPRAIQAILKKQFIRGSDITISGSGVVTMPTEGSYFVVNGSGFSISGFSTNYNGRIVTLEFTGALTLTNSASFFMINAANITTAAGDTAVFVNETGSTWRAISYNKVTNTFATIASPTFTGVPAAPTAAAGTNTTQLATTAFVTTADNLKAPLASPSLTGTPTAPTAAAGTNTTQLATTAFVTTADNLKANLASPTFTGIPTAPTAAAGTNTTQLATTAFVNTGWSESAELNLTVSELKSFTHGLGRVPNYAYALIRCKTNESGFIVGDELYNFCKKTGDTYYVPLTVKANATTVESFCGGDLLAVFRETDGIFNLITNANWSLVFRCR
jgi:hypothetical protein